MSTTVKRRLTLLTGLAGLLSLLPVASAAAVNYGHGTYGTCTYEGCSITLTTSSTVNLNVTPATSGSCTIQSDTVGVTTHNSAGFSLTATNSSTDTTLVSGANHISASTGTIASPSPLSNSWGFRIDGLGGFGSGPTSAQTNVATSSTGFAGMPASNGTPVTLATTSSYNASTVNTTVWYGVCADWSVKSGTYTTQITYTAVLN